MAESHPAGSSPELAERNFLNLGIWQRSFDLIIASPNQGFIHSMDLMFPHRETASSDKVAPIFQPRVHLQAESVDEDRIREIGLALSRSGLGQVVASVSFTEEAMPGLFEHDAATYWAYSLFCDGKIRHFMAVGDKPADKMMPLREVNDISVAERRDLLDRLTAIDLVS